MPLYKMRNDAIKYQRFNMHFHLEMKYITSQKYLTNRKEKELIHFWNLIQKPYIIFFKGVLLLIQSIGLEKGNKKDDLLFWWCHYFMLHILFKNKGIIVNLMDPIVIHIHILD